LQLFALDGSGVSQSGHFRKDNALADSLIFFSDLLIDSI